MNMMERHNLFVTPIWFKKLNLDLNLIKDWCLELKNNRFPNRTLSNVGGWQSVNINLNNYSELESLKEALDTAIDEMCITIHPELCCRLDNVWININEQGNYNNTHVHPVTAFAGTFYVQTPPDSGNIVLFSESQKNHYPFNGLGSGLFHEQVSIIPEENSLIIFPSWIEHAVEVSNSPLPRISISFNLVQIMP